jgi:hypothetical protein
VANNLIYANAGDGIDAADEPRGSFAQAVRGSADREPRYLVQNTIHANLGHGIVVSRVGNLLLANNAVTSNGAGEGFGVFRRPGPRGRSLPDIRVSNNLICDNRSGEVSEGILGQNQSGNATPTGSEAEGVSASPECQDSTGVYQNAPGSDDLAGTGDDDFALTLPRSDGPPSPAIDRGTDPRGLGLDSLLEPVLLADFSAPAVRPIQRDTNRTGDFDIGAVEIPCDCHENCESCRIAIEEDGSSLDQCPGTYSGEQCCNRITGEVTEKHEGAAYEVCPDTRSQRPGFDSGSSSDGCSAVPDHPLLLCPEVRFGCDEDSGVEGCGEGIDLPCNNHDFCYQTCGTTQALCDVAFYDDMIRVCNEMSFGQKLVCYDDCVIRAGAYFDGVAFGPFGRDAFENGQNRACQCCQNVFPEEAELGMSLLRD